MRHLYESDAEDDRLEAKWLAFRLDNALYSISLKHVREILRTQNVFSLPGNPKYIPGMIKLRNSTLTVMDLRIRFGMKSLADERKELAVQLTARKQDHLDWLADLRGSVNEKRAFKRGLDPHKCAFGLWYDNFTTDDLVLLTLLKKLDTPHQYIHGIGAEVISLAEQGKFEDAETLIRMTENRELTKMVTLLDTIIGELNHTGTQVVLLIETANTNVGFIVDRVETIFNFDPENAEPTINGGHGHDAITGIAKPWHDDKTVLLLDPEKLINGHDLMEKAIA